MSAQRAHRAPIRTVALVAILVFGLAALAAALWVGLRGAAAAEELSAARSVASVVRDDIVAGNADAATASLATLIGHTNRAVALTSDPVWAAAEHMPFAGANLTAVRQGAAVVDDIASDVAGPLIPIAGSLAIAPVAGATIDLAPLTAAAPTVAAARDAVEPIRAASRKIETGSTLPFIRDAVNELTALVESTADTVASLDRATALLPGMLGGTETRNYLLLVQNNAELRSSGGLIGATAVLTASGGSLTVSQQKSTTDYPVLAEPVLPVTPAEANLYGEVLGRYIMDVNLTPDFARAAELAIAMAEPVYGMRFHGAVAIDPFVLQRVLGATGPVSVGGGVALDGTNAVRVLLSDVYRDIPDPRAQDVFFADATDAVFDAVTSEGVDQRVLLSAVADGAAEGRILLFSTDPSEQAVLAETSLAGSLPPPSEEAVGIYLNDATGGKMGLYLETVAEVGCSRVSGSANHRATVTLTSAAPTDAATSLSALVTGKGIFGVEAGDIRTQVLVVLPAGASVHAATRGDDKVATVARDDGGRTVVSLFVQVSPGEAVTVSVDFMAVEVESVAGTPGVAISHPERGPTGCAADR